MSIVLFNLKVWIAYKKWPQLEDINKLPEIKHKIPEANEIMVSKLFLLLAGMMMKAVLAIAECLRQEKIVHKES